MAFACQVNTHNRFIEKASVRIQLYEKGWGSNPPQTVMWGGGAQSESCEQAGGALRIFLYHYIKKDPFLIFVNILEVHLLLLDMNTY